MRTNPGAARPAMLERPNAGSGTDTPEEIERYLTALVAERVLKEDPAALASDILAQRRADDVERLQRASGRLPPGVCDDPGVPPEKLNRQLRRAQRRRNRIAPVIADMIERARREGADWKPTAFPALDWRIRSEVWAAMRDITGKRARILAAGLPPAQGEQLVREAKRIAQELEVADGYATVRWRELVAAAWVSWRLSRPVRSRPTSFSQHASESTLGAGRPERARIRQNPWAGGRVVDGYAREAFCLLMQDIRTGEPMSKSKLFYTNGSGQLGAFAYLSTRGALGLYSRWQPPAWKSKYVGPPKRDASGNLVLDKDGNPQRYALAEHWYHARMCGRRAAAQTDRGNEAATQVLRELCPWLFQADATPAELLANLATTPVADVGAAGFDPSREALALAAPGSASPPD